jgi:hypothetical protein
MIYRGPSFPCGRMIRQCAVHYARPLLLLYLREQIVSRSQSSCVSLIQLTDGRGGGRGAESYDRKKAWASINRSNPLWLDWTHIAHLPTYHRHKRNVYRWKTHAIVTVDAKQLVKDAGNRREGDNRREDSNIRNAWIFLFLYKHIQFSQ